MTRLFRDWRVALLWVIGISTLAAAYFSQGSGPQDLLTRPAPAAPGAAPAVSPAAPASPAVRVDANEEEGGNFGDPVLDTTPFDPSPPEPAAAASPAAGPAGASAPAPATP